MKFYFIKIRYRIFTFFIVISLIEVFFLFFVTTTFLKRDSINSIKKDLSTSAEDTLKQLEDRKGYLRSLLVEASLFLDPERLELNVNFKSDHFEKVYFVHLYGKIVLLQGKTEFDRIFFCTEYSEVYSDYFIEQGNLNIVNVCPVYFNKKDSLKRIFSGSLVGITKLNNYDLRELAKKNNIDIAITYYNRSILSSFAEFSHKSLKSMGDASLLIIQGMPYLIEKKAYSDNVMLLYSSEVFFAKSFLPVLGQINRITNNIIIFFLVFILLLFIAAIVISWQTTKPISNLINAIQKVGIGDYEARVNVRVKDEIGILASEFNKMIKKIASARESMIKYTEDIKLLQLYNYYIIESIPEPLLTSDKTLKIEYFNNASKKLFGQIKDRTDLKTLFLKVFKNDDYNEIINAVKTEREIFKKNIILKNNHIYNISTHIVKLQNKNFNKSIIYFQDITDIIKMESRILQSERLSSLGILSAGIAHEINNPLGAILSHVQLLKEDTNISDAGHESLKWIESETRRIDGIVTKLLNFASIDSDNSNESCNPETALRLTLDFISHFAKRNKVLFEIELSDEDISVITGIEELKQVFLNLFLNSITAMENSTEKNIKIVSSVLDKNWQVIISDTGCGFKSEDSLKIFDPFFTTRQGRGGTGLGLSLCFRIIKKAGGSIEAMPIDYGARFVILMPINGRKK